jgi:hypothetical protein
MGKEVSGDKHCEQEQTQTHFSKVCFTLKSLCTMPTCACVFLNKKKRIRKKRERKKERER